MTRKKNKGNRPWLNSKGKQKKDRDRNRNGETDDRDKQDNLEKENALFEAYYAAQEVMLKDEWTECMKYLRKGLPITFRFSGSRATAESLNTLVKNTYAPELRNIRVPVDNDEEDPEETKPPAQLPWYPNGLGWQFNVSKRNLRRIPEFKRFHQFLIYETDVGNVSRQEAVSMIPPLFLEVKPGDMVLDMCAAPGSKTAQLLEALHTPVANETTIKGPGLLIANDSDMKRAHLLIHQSARMSSDKLMVTNLDASRFPWLHLSRNEKLRFTKILCDVPCSGDGTLRKNPGIWKKWNVGNGNGLHSLQLRILQRAMTMLSNSGDSRLVYSTCTMNPIENEAVVAAALNTVPGFELENVRNLIPSLITREGMKTWSPQPSSWSDSESSPKTWRSWEEYCKCYEEDGKSQMGSKQQLKDKLAETMFPPTNIETLHLERCMRFHPHLMDTGGFFVAVLKRSGQVGIEIQASEEGAIEDSMASADNDITRKRTLAPTNETENGTCPWSKRIKIDPDKGAKNRTSKELIQTGLPNEDAKNQTERGGGEFKELPCTFLPSDHPQISSVKQSLALSSFPYDHLFIRAAKPTSIGDTVVRIFYLANPIVKAIIVNNDYIRMRLLHAGAKILAKQDKGEVQFRILDEGLETMLPYMKEDQIVQGNFDDLRPLLREQCPFFKKLPEGGFRDAVEKHSPGNVFGRFCNASSDQLRMQYPITMSLWRSDVSISLMVKKKSKIALSLRLFGEDITQSKSDETLATEKDSEAADSLAVDDNGMPEETQ